MSTIPTRLRSIDGRTALVEFDHYGLTPRQARDFASDLLSEATYAERLPSVHERHVNLLASCPLCVHEAGSQTDRLHRRHSGGYGHMRSVSTSKRTIIDIMSETWVESDGKIEVQTITLSHGNAKYTSLGRLNGAGHEWWVSDADNLILLATSTKAEAVESFTSRAIAQAAQWAAR